MDGAKEEEGSASLKSGEKEILMERKGVGTEDWEAGEEKAIGHTKEAGG